LQGEVTQKKRFGSYVAGVCALYFEMFFAKAWCWYALTLFSIGKFACLFCKKHSVSCGKKRCAIYVKKIATAIRRRFL